LAPPKSIHLNPFHYTATKSSFTPLEITTGQDKVYGHTAHIQNFVFCKNKKKHFFSTLTPGLQTSHSHQEEGEEGQQVVQGSKKAGGDPHLP
jgi:hypothetical protein